MHILGLDGNLLRRIWFHEQRFIALYAHICLEPIGKLQLDVQFEEEGLGKNQEGSEMHWHELKIHRRDLGNGFSYPSKIVSHGASRSN